MWALPNCLPHKNRNHTKTETKNKIQKHQNKKHQRRKVTHLQFVTDIAAHWSMILLVRVVNSNHRLRGLGLKAVCDWTDVKDWWVDVWVIYIIAGRPKHFCIPCMDLFPLVQTASRSRSSCSSSSRRDSPPVFRGCVASEVDWWEELQLRCWWDDEVRGHFQIPLTIPCIARPSIR